MAKVQIYTSAYCGYCHAAKRLLTQKGVEYSEVSIDQNPELRADLMRRSGQRTVPQIWIGDTHVGGYTDIAALEQGGELDKLLSSSS